MIIIISGKTEALFQKIAEKKGLGLQSCMEHMINAAAEECEFQQPVRIADLPLSGRLQNVLRYFFLDDDRYWPDNAAYRSLSTCNATVADLAKAGQRSILAMRNSGRKTLMEAMNICEQHGYEMAG